MITLPGTLSTPTAGPILTRGAPVHATPESGAWGAGVVRFSTHDEDARVDVAWDFGGMTPEPRSRVVLDLTADLGPTIALRWLGRHYGIDVGIGCPAWVYSAATRDSVASWSLIGVDGKRYVFCNYPPDIEANLGPPVDRETYANLRNLPTDPLEALVAACLYAAGVPRE